MGFIYSSLNKSDGESWSQFDNRITRMLPFVTGVVYFDLRNYDACTGEFGVYAEWDKEFENVLRYDLPGGGYFVKATISQAYSFHKLGCGLPVYMKLISHGGKLYPYRTYVVMDGRPFSLEFGGGDLIPIDDRFDELGCEAAGESYSEISSEKAGSQRPVRNGSQRFMRNGSQRFMRNGSQRFVWNASQMRMLFGSQGGFRYLAGSQYRLTGSQRFAHSGSQRFVWTGSQRFVRNASQRFTWNCSQILEKPDSTKVSYDLLMEFPQEWQLINKSRRPEKRIGGNARFGYGLDLI